MTIHLKNGIDKLLFGMKQSDVIAIYGKANRSYKDEDGNAILVYNALKMRFTFYHDEDLRLGYIIASSPKLALFGHSIIGQPIQEIKTALSSHGITQFVEEEFDTIQNHFNEDNWMIVQTEFDEIIKIEIGAIINNKDEFDWKFGNK